MGFFGTLLAVIFATGGLAVGALVGATRRISDDRRGLILPALIGAVIGFILGALIIPILKFTIGLFVFFVIAILVAVIAAIIYFWFRKNHPRS